MVHFRHRIGPEGIELIFKESIRVNGKDSNDKDIYIDTTVQEKNITFPTDDKLAKKVIKRCRKIAAKNRLELRQSYRRTLKRLSHDQRFRNHPRNKDKAGRADRKVRTIAGRLVRDVEKKLGTRVDAYQKNKERKYFRKRAGIEPVIGHLKEDHRLSRNYYKGITGDEINVMLAAAEFNFKRMMNKWKSSFGSFWSGYFCS